MSRPSIDPTVPPTTASVNVYENIGSIPHAPLTPPPTVSKKKHDSSHLQGFSPVSPTPVVPSLNVVFNPPMFNMPPHQTPSAGSNSPAKSDKEALFLPKDEEDDSDSDSIVCLEDQSTFLPHVVNTSNAIVVHNPSVKVKVKYEQDTSELEHFNLAADRQALQTRVRDEDSDEEDVEYRGQSKRLKPSGSTNNSSRDGGTPLRALSVDDDDDDENSHGDMVCRNCGCNDVEQAGPPGGGLGVRRGRGKGSTTLSPRVRGNILALLLGKTSLFQRLRGGRIKDWADISEMVGARREDFDRVRHAADGLQKDLPDRMRRGQI